MEVVVNRETIKSCQKFHLHSLEYQFVQFLTLFSRKGEYKIWIVNYFLLGSVKKICQTSGENLSLGKSFWF